MCEREAEWAGAMSESERGKERQRWAQKINKEKKNGKKRETAAA